MSHVPSRHFPIDATDDDNVVVEYISAPVISPVKSDILTPPGASNPRKRRLPRTNLQDALSQLPIPRQEGGSFLAAATPHPLDATIRFVEDTHAYYVAWFHEKPDDFVSTDTMSTSQFIHQFFPAFDAMAIIEKMQRGRKFHLGPYANMTPDQIKAQWDENGRKASQQGTFFHLLCELDMNNELDLGPYEHVHEVQQYLGWKRKHFMEKNLVPFRTELRMRSDAGTRLTGTADLIAIQDNHPAPEDCNGVLTLHLRDWKNSKAIKMTNFFSKGYGLCAALDDCNYVHYALQQNLYRWFLETFYANWTWRGKRYTSVSVASMQLVVCHPNHGEEALVVDLPNLQHLVRDMVELRRQHLLSVWAARSQGITEPSFHTDFLQPIHNHHKESKEDGESEKEENEEEEEEFVIE